MGTAPTLADNCYYCGRAAEGQAGAYVTTFAGPKIVRLCHSAARDCMSLYKAALLEPGALSLSALTAKEFVLSVMRGSKRWVVFATHPQVGTVSLLDCPTEAHAYHMATRVKSLLDRPHAQRALEIRQAKEHLAWRASNGHARPSSLVAIERLLEHLGRLDSVLS
jgi:hypothetical protein